MSGTIQASVNGQSVRIDTAENVAYNQAQTDDAGLGPNPLAGLTLANAVSAINTQVTDLASAKVALVRMARILFKLNAEVEYLKTRIK